MTFREIKQGHPIYILHKTDSGLETEIGKVKIVSQPRFPQQYNGGNALGMVVDITIEEKDSNKTYVVPVDSSVVSAGNTVLSIDRDGILREVDALEAESDDVINSIDKHRARKQDCEKIKTDWNPIFAEKKQQDERISSLESEVKGIGAMLKDFINEFKK